MRLDRNTAESTKVTTDIIKTKCLHVVTLLAVWIEYSVQTVVHYANCLAGSHG